MNRASAIYLIFAIGFHLQAQIIDISGKVTDQSDKPIEGAIVSLKSKNVADTTDATGAYSLKASLTSAKRSILPGTNPISLKNRTISVNLTQPAPVCLEFFDVRGKLLEKIDKNKLSAGNHQFTIKNYPLAQNMLIIRVSTGLHSAIYHYITSNNGISTIISSNSSTRDRLAKTQARADTLQASAPGYKTKKVLVDTYEEKIDIILETEADMNCTKSKIIDMNVSVSGPCKVVVETNSDLGINEGTIYRPEDLGPGKNYPIFAWGEGACSMDGGSNSAAMAEIASHGYFVIADGTPGGSGSRPMNGSDIIGMGKPMIAYIDWIIAENRKPCSDYYQSIDTSKIGVNGFSCGGLLSMGTAHDPRITTWGLTSSGSFNDNKTLWNSVHTPVLIIEGHQDETGAYNNGLRDYNGIAPLGHPVMFLSNKTMGHGGDLWNKYGGEFTKINLAWLNWWLKGDTGANGKGVLAGAGCKYCTDSNWEVKSANLP